jgi:hypothetical protein
VLKADHVTEPGPTSQLVREWTVCAIAAAASRFIPVPMLDNAIYERATRIAIARTLRQYGRTYSSSVVEPLYDPEERSGVLRSTLRFGRSIVLFPVRKYVAIFGAVRGVPTDMMIVLMLARTTARCLAAGQLSSSDPKELRREALAIRRAFDASVRGMDLRLLTSTLAEGLSQAQGLTAAAVIYARRSFGRDQERPELNPGGEVGATAARLQVMFRRPEIAEVLREFDVRFDAKLQAVA